MNRRTFVTLAAAELAAASAAPASPSGGCGAATTPNGGVIRVLCIPYVSEEGRVEANVDGAMQVIRQEVAKSPVDLVVLPELFTCGYCGFDLSPFAEPEDGPSARKFAQLSRELNILIGYGFAETSGQRRVYNTWLLVEPDGKRHRYRKTHLHPTPAGGKTNEPEFLLPGKTLEPFHTRLGTIGVMICYDGCFVEVPRVLALKGADFILWPSRSGGYLAGRGLPQVRSLDNAITTLLVEGGQTGKHLPMETWSAVYSEKGSRIVSQKNDNAVFRVNVDVCAGRALRASTDAGAHTLYGPRRPELYGVIGQTRKDAR